ncbi:hypothetical protein K469DRAFT_596105, partial [Zopfia rhizophila CBS 207.26]
TPATYSTLISALPAYSYVSERISLPSVCCNPLTHDFTKDVQAVKTTLTILTDEGKDIILMIHSYNGLPGVEAV